MTTNRDNILLVANWDSGVGYAWWLMESYWRTIAERYHEKHDIILAYPSVSTVPDRISGAPLKVVEHPIGAGTFPELIRTLRFLREQNIRFIYFSDRSTWHWVYALYRIFGLRRIIVHDHTPGVRTEPTGWKRTLKQLIHRIRYISADAAIGATEYVRRRLVEVNGMPSNRCFAVPNGLPALDPPPPLVPVRSLFCIPSDRVIMVMTGRASRYKGVDFVLSCLAYLKRQKRNEIHFLFCGDGPDLDHFRRQAVELGIQANTTFAGRRGDIPGLLPACDLAIHPSQGEVGYSLSILEYMRAGLPVLVPDNPSVCGATEHGVTGFIYPAGDVRTASEEIARLAEQPELMRRVGLEAKSRVARDYNLDSAHQALLGVFDRFIETDNN